MSEVKQDQQPIVISVTSQEHKMLLRLRQVKGSLVTIDTRTYAITVLGKSENCNTGNNGSMPSG